VKINALSVPGTSRILNPLTIYNVYLTLVESGISLLGELDLEDPVVLVLLILHMNPGIKRVQVLVHLYFIPKNKNAGKVPLLKELQKNQLIGRIPKQVIY
jgi:hypothetical protein